MSACQILPYQQISVDFMMLDSKNYEGIWQVEWIDRDYIIKRRSFSAGYLAAVFAGELVEKFNEARSELKKERSSHAK